MSTTDGIQNDVATVEVLMGSGMRVTVRIHPGARLKIVRPNGVTTISNETYAEPILTFTTTTDNHEHGWTMTSLNYDGPVALQKIKLITPDGLMATHIPDEKRVLFVSLVGIDITQHIDRVKREFQRIAAQDLIHSGS